MGGPRTGLIKRLLQMHGALFVLCYHTHRDDWPTYWADDWRHIDFQAYSVGPIRAMGLRTEEESAPMSLQTVKITQKGSGATALFK